MIRALLTLSLLAAPPPTAQRGEEVSLIDAGKEHGGWTFDNGKEFPGARGGLELSKKQHREQPVLELKADFRKGGGYVQAATKLPELPLDTLSFWIETPPGVTAVPVRLGDGSGQCHQLKLKINDRGGWQRIVLPVDRYFRHQGTADALDITSQYQKWGGANDGKWHQPGKYFVVLCTRGMGDASTIRLSDVQLRPARPKTSITKTIPLDEELAHGQPGWAFNPGHEYPGAKGGLEVTKDQTVSGHHALRLHGDFTGGGAYVGIRKRFENLDVKSIDAIRMKLRSDTTKQFALRMVDGSGQTHQRKGIAFTPDGQWHDLIIRPEEVAGGEHWGGANDGKWHGSPRLVELMLNTRSHKDNKPELLLADIRGDVVVEATTTAASFTESFDSAKALHDGWRTTGDVLLADGTLTLARTLDHLQAETAATSKPFAVAPGTWRIRYRQKPTLHSPDNSYRGRVLLELLGPSGKVIETMPIAIGHGRHDWTTIDQTVTIPRGIATARLRIDLQKTYGTYQVDDLAAARLGVQPIEQRIARVLISSPAIGNLFLPEEPVVFQVTIEATKPLAPSDRTLYYSVRDYWNAEQLPPGDAMLVEQPPNKGTYRYRTEITLPKDELAVGKFYQLFVEIPQSTAATAKEFSGLAILPPAIAKNYPAEKVPFTIRNWDSRVPAYFHLADRLGLRMLGVWGGWSSKPPYKPHCPGIDTCQKLGDKWITGTPAAQIERHGFTKYSEESLREGMRNFLEAFADKGLARIAMGNEPHGTGQKVLDNVRAYRAIYETVKAFDPEIHVIGTSVEPNEEYFKAGYQHFLDSYDFHIYEHYTNVRKSMRRYRELMEDYDAVKPINSTELGLNSQGQARLDVAREMIKKLTVFFAEGGDMVAWFTIQYPDPKGKARGQFGDAHCMFDCKYNLYNPRLDAITHYHLLNAICVKKFAEEMHYPNRAQAYLFRDDKGKALQILWLDRDRKEVSIPLPADQTVRLLAIDGTERELHSGDGAITMTLGDDPIMLLYDDKETPLASELGAPALALDEPPAPIAPGGSTTISLAGENLRPESLRVSAPPRWKSAVTSSGNGRLTIRLDAPMSATAREARVHLRALVNGQATAAIEVPIKVTRGAQ
ncbi:hypothetical protein Pan216_08190 [Planctomycetes bacterium Pan216]|uniref:Uncharacterized protein n=2 Tax=Kolteria novifilia TaxID=2527975 RepID=A0A518AZ64_9BACT|nr:hypothetical protein Pan216_08190 [Planctomycetes bacterium Pan216]